MAGVTDSNLGELVIVEGAGSAGKSTVIDELESQLQDRGQTVETFGEFSETDYGQQLEAYMNRMGFDSQVQHPISAISDNAGSMSPVFSLATAQLLDLAISVELDLRPALRCNNFVLKERLFHSALVLEPVLYESEYQDGDKFREVVSAFEAAAQLPERTIFHVEIPDSERKQRLEAQNDEGSNLDENFSDIARRFRELDGYVPIDNNRPLSETVEEMLQHLMSD